MTKVVSMKVEPRRRIGKGGARAVRREGFVPGIIYGNNEDSVSVKIPRNKFISELYAGGFFTKLFDLDLEGNTMRVLPRDVQFHPVKDLPEHIDFMRVTDKTKIHLEVPIHTLNAEECPGVKEGGVLNIIHHNIEVWCLAGNIPSSIDIDVSALAMHESIKLGDITLPDGVEIHYDDDEPLVQVAAPRAVVEEEDEDAEEVAPDEVEATAQGGREDEESSEDGKSE